MKKIYSLILLMLLASCGTLTKKDEYIQVDSSPRGLEVLDSNKKSIGVTPFTLLSNQKRKSFFYAKGDPKEITYRCSFDWQHSVVPSLLIMPLAIPVTPVISTTFLGIDYITDNLFSCKKPLFIKSKVANEYKKVPSKVLVLPVFNGQNHDVQQVVDKVISKIKTQHTFISYIDSLNFFSAQGITEESFWNLRNIKSRSLIKVINASGASHVMTLKKTRNGEFKAQIYDLYTKKPVTKKILVKSKKVYNDLSIKTLTKKYLYFIPNSIGIGKLGTTAGIDHIENDETSYETTKHPNDFHWLASMWVFSNISSPYLFDTWDYDFRLSPHISFPAYRAQFDKDYSIDIQNYNLTYDFTATGHMPIGAISFSLGAGGTYVYGEDSLNNDFSAIHTLLHVNLSYSAFITERVFVRLAFDSYSTLKDKVINNYVIEGSTHSSLSLGYYFPELRSFLR